MPCPTCHRWEPAGHDLYCGWCGSQLVDFELELSDPLLYVGESYDAVELRVRATGHSGAVDVRSVTRSRDWFTLVPVPCKPIPNGQSETVARLEVNTSELPDDYHEAVLTVETNAGAKDIDFRATPYPVVEVRTGKFEIFLDDREVERNECSISVTRGRVTVKELRTDQKWAEIRYPQGTRPPSVLDARERPELVFDLHINERLLREQGLQLPAELKGNVIIRYQELSRPRLEGFQVNCYDPPLLREEYPAKVEVFAGQRGQLVLTLGNGRSNEQGRAALRVKSIEVCHTDNRPCGWVRLADSLELPLEVASGASKEIAFWVHSSETPERPSGGQDVVVARLQVRIETNEVLDRRRLPFAFTVEIREMPPFDGLVTIDYGTTNSCANALHPNLKEDPIPIDETRRPHDPGDGTVAPSAIQYLDWPREAPRKCEIGSEPAALRYRGAKTVVASAKRSLGSASRRFSVEFRDDRSRTADLQARDVVADYLRKVRQQVENHLRARVQRVLLTHPSKFSLLQIGDLDAAAREVFGAECKPEHMHEPVAAALDQIVSNRRSHYTMMVYDFGGGTTDITLLDVRNREDPDAVVETTIEVLGADGNPRQGGDDATDILARIALEKCRSVYRRAKQLGDKAKFDIPVDADPFPQGERRRKVEINRMALLAWAEMAKILLTDQDDRRTVPDQHKFLELLVFTATGEEVHPFPHADIVPVQAEFERAVREWLVAGRTMEMMKGLQKKNNVTVDMILLSGRSALLRPLKPLVREHFPLVREDLIVLAKDPKACVVRGACLLEKYRDVGAGRQIKVISGSATTSRIGLRGAEGDQPMFKPIVEAGEPIPEGGLHRPVKVRLSRTGKITLMEDTGGDNRIFIDGRRNENIREYATFDLSALEGVSDEQLRHAQVKLEISRNLDLTLRAIIPEAVAASAVASGASRLPETASQERPFELIRIKAEQRLAAQA